jgi:putative ABC transport system substrate-binding protein
MSLLGQFDQFFEGITIVFKSLFNALWHLIGHVSARYAGKLRHVLIHQFPTRPLTDIVAKDLEMFKDALPQASRIGILWNPTTPSHPPALKAVEAAGAMLEVSLHMVPMSTVEDFDGAFATMTRERLDGFLVVASPVALSQRARLAELALAHRLPGVFASKENVEAGGFMSYGPDNDDLTRRAALYIVKILNGTKPADLPVEQATKFELVVNLKTVKVLGLKISESFLLRANEVIE